MLKKTIKFSLFAAILSSMIFAWSCAKTPGNDDQIKTNGFDFKTIKEVSLDIDYRLQGYGSKIILEIYSKNPDLNENLEPLFRAFTNNDGQFFGETIIPDYLETVYLHTEYSGVPRTVAIPVKNGAVTFDANIIVEQTTTKAATKATYTYPSDINTLGSWSALGLPDYLGKRVNPETALNKILNDYFVENDNNSFVATGANTVIEVTSAITKGLDMVFLHDGGELKNVIGYYMYPKSTPPASVTDVRKTLIFPNAAFKNGGGDLTRGDVVRLNYWNGTSYQETIPAGTIIEFFMIPAGFSNGNITAPETFYSRYNWVSGQKQQIATFNTNGTELGGGGVKKYTVIAFEETNRNNTTINGYNDFNDVVVYLDCGNADAIVPAGPPVGPIINPDPIETSVTYKGTLIYEDLWPHRGDYDLNDVVIEYTCIVYKNTDNNITRVEDLFKPVHNGATLQSGFAYRYNVTPSSIESIKVTTNAPTGNVLGGTRPTVAIPWTTDALGLETGQDLATLKLYDDNRVLATSQGGNYEFKVITKFKSAQDPGTFNYPPYDPFIIIQHDDPSPRDRELHLADNKPTSKANCSQWFGYANDISNVSQNRYYISNDNYPFAINIPIHNFKLATESSKIDQLYPQYYNWASSNGTTNKDWYLHPNN